MREVGIESFREEVYRLRGAVALMPIYHFSGTKLHDAGSPINPTDPQLMQRLGMQAVYFPDQGEGDLEAQRSLSTQTIDLRDLAIGDVLADNIFDDAGEVMCPPGTFIDAPLLEGNLRGQTGPITIKKRGMKGAPEQAATYLQMLPPSATRPRRPDPGGEPITRATRPLLAPRARILVTLEDGFQRALMLNICASEGHETMDRRWIDVTVGDFARTKVDAIILELSDAPAALALIRKSDVFRSVAVLVTAPEGRRNEVFKALSAGANGSIPMPVKRDVLLDRIHHTIQAMGRPLMIKPGVIKERRTVAREGGHMLCTLQDKFLSSPLAVKEATLIDVSDQGLKIEYRRPAWAPHVYLAHGVHPQHYFFNYARDNPLGRDVNVTFPSAGGRTLDGHAKFVHISTAGDFEIAGLQLQRMKSSVREHMTAVRGGSSILRPTAPINVPRPPSTTRRAF
jgi:hypothetical protein